MLPVEVKEVSVPGTRLERMSDTYSRRLAGRVSRRSFFGRLGQGAIAATLGSVGVDLLSRPAQAHSNWCQSNCSIGCAKLTGTNWCPADTCECGCWCIRVSSSTCTSTYREWCDCCGGCNDSNRGCVGGSDGLTHPTCLFHKEYSGGCGTLGSTHIKCRRHQCVKDYMCERFGTQC